MGGDREKKKRGGSIRGRKEKEEAVEEGGSAGCFSPATGCCWWSWRKEGRNEKRRWDEGRERERTGVTRKNGEREVVGGLEGGLKIELEF